MENLFELLEPFSIFKILSLPERKLSEDFILYLYIVAFLAFIYNIITFFLDRFTDDLDVQSIFTRRRVTRYTFFFFGLFCSIPIFYSKISYLPTILAFTGAGFIISIKDITLNFAGWFLIHGSSGFAIGDRIEIGDVKGEVINIGLMRFTLLEVKTDHNSDQSSNRLVHIPNHQAIIQKIFVISQDMEFIWDEVYIFLTTSSNWQKAKSICEKILSEVISHEEYSKIFENKIRRLSKNYLVRLGKITPIVYVTLEEGKVMLSLRYLTHFHHKRQNRAFISEKILVEFKKEKSIHFFTHGI
ncbi:MAG TPA: mechanosensitive ion channel [Leptospiraceae bacterium]|nr:mechanosensitive ion channel [Leptospiraceae bacterium]HMW07867.1 mechanosensitive ion channel [Leptospiraceae bacterium]HMX32353.1 mechanosensitive ion channel [Leptospiraceae bacterium]HMY32672.1 mechanosensitive ion channel [Leptospiraceae bacterium]HMZ66046.1 mechanosensitive ion channel [Leptospiraceae bacterium]